MIAIALVFSIMISLGSFAWGYWQAGYEGISRWIIGFGIFWLVAQWRKWRWVSTAGIFLFILLAIVGVWLNFIAGWMFSGSIFAFFAWNLTEFQHSLSFVNARDDVRGMSRRHLARISLLAMAGLMLVSLFVLARGQFSLEWGMFLLGVLLVGSLQLVAWFRK
ncbi:MAG: hypothetical protein JNK32_08255 [Anaerolineales bacterium]|nr:hypothetical protein [Anaerolineales bacterium]